MAQKIKNFITALTLLLLFSYLMPSMASAAPCLPSASNTACVCSSQGCDDGTPVTQTLKSDPNCNNSTDAGVQKCLKNNQIVKDLNIVVNFLSVGVGIIVIGVIILGGIQYSLAGDNSTATGAAKKRITDGLIALAAFIFTFAFLQWLIPGGL